MPDTDPHPLDQHGDTAEPAGGRRREKLTFLHLLPNLVTILGLCAGLTSIRFVFDGRYELAVVLIIFAAVIDGLDGLLARRLKAASTFGAELDTLSDFVTFGVAPALLVYQLALADIRGIGWIFALVFSICCCLRLARFNVHRDAPPPPGRAYFTGVPAPAGALLGLMPAFLTFEGILTAGAIPHVVAVYLGLIGLLMVSRLRTLSPKAIRISRDHVPWILVGTAFLIGVMLTRLWLLMVIANLAYLALIAHGIATAHRKSSP